MNAQFRRHDLALRDPFAIARGAADVATVFVVRLERDGLVGVGGCAPSAYYGEPPASVAAALPDLLAVAEAVDDPHAGQRVARRLREAAPDKPAARAAVSTALAVLAARDLGSPLYRQWGLDPEAAPPTSYTVGIADPDEMARRARAAAESGFDHLKVKLGTDDDRARFEAVRAAAPGATIRVDANEAWDAETAVANADWLAGAGASFLEQPVPAADPDALRRVHREAALPVCADESCVTAADVPRVADSCDLVTVKLTKCGGLRPALAQIHAARAHGLGVMIGCMVGALLLAEDVCEGVPVRDGEMDLRAVAAGTGARTT